ncbi:MAG: hypothetical protein OHK0019_35880 [Saprospiraceae bacterium]
MTLAWVCRSGSGGTGGGTPGGGTNPTTPNPFGPDPLGWGNNQPGNSSGGGGTGNSNDITDLFDPEDFVGMERKVAVEINKFKILNCLSNSSPALLGEIKSSCGLSNDPDMLFFELKESLYGELPNCVKEVIIDDWLDLSASEKNYLLNNSALYDNLVNFVKSKGCGCLEDESTKLFVEYVIERLHSDPSIPINTDLGQYNFFDSYDPIINYLNSNTEPEDEINNGIEIDYIIQAPPSPPSAGRLLGGSPDNPNGGQDAIGRTNGDINILPPHMRERDNYPEWNLKLEMELLFYIATHGDVDEILDGMGDEVSTAYLNKFFANKNGTFHEYQNAHYWTFLQNA